jgi:hypothetical protein
MSKEQGPMTKQAGLATRESIIQGKASNPSSSWRFGRNGWRDGIMEEALDPPSTRSSNVIRFLRFYANALAPA